MEFNNILRRLPVELRESFHGNRRLFDGSLGIERGQHLDTAGVDILLENIDQILKNKAELDRPKDRCLSDFMCSKE